MTSHGPVGGYQHFGGIYCLTYRQRQYFPPKHYSG